MDGNEDVSEEVIESHLSCLFESGSESGLDGGVTCSVAEGFAVDDGPGRTVWREGRA